MAQGGFNDPSIKVVMLQDVASIAFQATSFREAN